MSKNLIIAPSWLGDLIMSQSLYKIIKEQDKNALIDIYAPSYTLPIIERMPEINNKIVNPFAHGSFELKKRISEGLYLKKFGYDHVYILPNSLKSALIAFFAGIPDRRGFKGESRYILINNMRSNKKDFPLMVERYVALAFNKEEVKTAKDLPTIPYPKLTVIPPKEDLLYRLKISLDRPLMALGCGANYGPSKLWPVEYFAKVSNWWCKKGGAVLALGSSKDLRSVEGIFSNLDKNNHKYFYNIAGKTSLTEALDLIGVCKCAVCNDSGLMHTVAAADIPQVCIFGSTTTNYTPPLSDKARCVESTQSCHPCFARTCKYNTYACLKEIVPNTVILELEKLLS